MTYFEITFDRAAAAAGLVDVWRVALQLRPDCVRVINVRAIYFGNDVRVNTVYMPHSDPQGRIVGHAALFHVHDRILICSGGLKDGEEGYSQPIDYSATGVKLAGAAKD